MSKRINWLRTLFAIGVVALIIGAIDPLEGSIIILVGSILMSVASYLRNDRYRTWFFAGALLITFGVASLFYLSFLGGFGGDSSLSWWWSVLILPYPMGWIMNIVILILRTRHKRKLKNS